MILCQTLGVSEIMRETERLSNISHAIQKVVEANTEIVFEILNNGLNCRWYDGQF